MLVSIIVKHDAYSLYIRIIKYHQISRPIKPLTSEDLDVPSSIFIYRKSRANQ